MSNQVAISVTVQQFPVGTTLSGYSVVMNGAASGSLPAFLIPAVAGQSIVTGTTPVLQPDTWTATITSVDANGNVIDGTNPVVTNAITVTAPTTIPLAIATSAVLS